MIALVFPFLFFFEIVQAQELKFPELSRRVTDEAGLLTAAEQASLEQRVQTLNASGKVQMAIYIPNSLQGYDIETFSIRLAEKWKLGKKGVDHGLLFIVAPKERQMRLEIGYGLEGVLTDIESHQIIERVLVPFFKQGRYADGIAASIQVISNKLEVPFEGEIAPLPQERSSGRKSSLPLYSIFIFVLFILLTSRSRRMGYRRSPLFWGGLGGGGWSGRSGGFGGGGFGGFGGGGGGFGGGGASGRW